MASAQETFVAKVDAKSWSEAADLLNGMSMPDLLASLVAVGSRAADASTQICTVLRTRGWVPSAERISFAFDALSAKKVPVPAPQGIPLDQVAQAQKFIAEGGGLSRVNADGKYTGAPSEVVRKQTPVMVKSVIAAIKAAWPEINDTGARILAAQFSIETGDGKACFNFNLGGVKGKETEPHFYMRTPECWSKPVWDAEFKKGGREPTALEKKNHDTCEPGTFLMMYDPPHERCRFLASTSFDPAVKKWLFIHKKHSKSHSDYLDALNRADFETIADILKSEKYYSAGKKQYLDGLKAKKALIDRTVKST